MGAIPTYSFDIFKREEIRAAWLSGNYTDEQLKEKYWQQYLTFCKEHGYKPVEAEEKQNMTEKFLMECEKEREKIIRNKKTNGVKGFKEYLDEREKQIKAKEEIIKILCGTDGMTPKTAERILDDTKELIIAVAMKQPFST